MAKIEHQEVEYPLSHGMLRGQWWRSQSQGKDKRVVVALHGWLDNSASFFRLAPLLAEHFSVLAVDWPGHGSSDPLLPGAHYYIWEQVEPLQQLLVRLKEEGYADVHLLGHSMGGIVASLYAASFPETLKSLILLDSLGPMTTEASAWGAQLAKGIKGGQRALRRGRSGVRYYASVEDAVESRQHATPTISEASLRPLVERNLMGCERGYAWRTDPRLRLSSKVRLTEEQVQGALADICVPVQVLLARQGIIPSAWLRSRLPCFKHSQSETLEGGHHFHLQEEHVVAVKDSTLAFLNQQYQQEVVCE